MKSGLVSPYNAPGYVFRRRWLVGQGVCVRHVAADQSHARIARGVNDSRAPVRPVGITHYRRFLVTRNHRLANRHQLPCPKRPWMPPNNTERYWWSSRRALACAGPVALRRRARREVRRAVARRFRLHRLLVAKGIAGRVRADQTYQQYSRERISLCPARRSGPGPLTRRSSRYRYNEKRSRLSLNYLPSPHQIHSQAKRPAGKFERSLCRISVNT